MKRLITLTLAFGITATTVLLAQAPRSIEAQFKAAQHAEEVEGDLKKAIEQYRQIAQSGDRAVAVRALMRMAECHVKLGDAAAPKVYERIIREYGDQPNALVDARNRLAQLSAGRKDVETHIVTRQIWVGNDANVEGRPSLDGKLLTFVDWKTSSTGNVAIRNLTTGKNRRLTNGTVEEGYAYEPVISPDGKQVAYVWYGEGLGSIRTMGVDGSNTRVLANVSRGAIYYPRWSADGRHLAVTLFNSDDRTWRIVLVAVGDGSMTTLKSTQWNEPVLGGFSPDGRFLVYAISKLTSTSENGIYAVAVDGSRESALVRGTAEDMWPVWSADGTAVVFLSDRSGNHDLWAVRVNDGKADGEPALVRANVGNIVNMGFTQDGSYFYGTRNTSQDVYVAALNPQTLSVAAPPRRLSEQFVGSNLGPAWSPDGRYIAFVRGKDRLKRTIVIRSVPSGVERTLPVKLLDGIAVGANGPIWLPDSRSLLVPDPDYTQRIVTIHQIDVETGDARQLLKDNFGKLDTRFALSPDGKVIYFVRREQGSGGMGLLRLIRREIVSGDERELYQAESLGVSFFGLAISPDGDRLSFMVNVGQKGERHLMIVPTTVGAARILYRGNYAHPSPQVGVWTGDGKYVIGVAEETKSSRRLWAFPVDGGQPRKLDIVFESIAAADLSPDGKAIAFTGTQTNAEVWTIKNLLPRQHP